MPPQRTIPPSKAIKTERTHEENQERCVELAVNNGALLTMHRAYIAASRRSDRSLEARVESARRASEIHKRRTGRSLRVTEQDVVNEEMYEEEDDDLPMQYRRLTAHLQTGSADFNQRLSSYLTHHVAMRSCLDQAITNSYAQQYPNAPQFAHNLQNVFPSPFMAHNMPQQQSSQPYVQSAYNIATGTPGFRSTQHVRSASVAGPNDIPGYNQNLSVASPVQAGNQADHRRMSMPAKSMSPSQATQTPHFMQSRPSLPHSSSSYTGKNQVSPSSRAKQEDQPLGQMQAPQSQPQQKPQQSYGNLAGYQSFSPFTTSLPTESQLLLGSVLDPNDPFTSMMMAGSENMMQPYYGSAPSLPKQQNFHPSYDGMSATLAPSALDISSPNTTNVPPNSAVSSSSLSGTPPFSLGFADGAPDTKSQNFTRSDSSHGSGSGTPVIDGGWDAFINDNSWAENGTWKSLFCYSWQCNNIRILLPASSYTVSEALLFPVLHCAMNRVCSSSCPPRFRDGHLAPLLLLAMWLHRGYLGTVVAWVTLAGRDRRSSHAPAPSLYCHPVRSTTNPLNSSTATSNILVALYQPVQIDRLDRNRPKSIIG